MEAGIKGEEGEKNKVACYEPKPLINLTLHPRSRKKRKKKSSEYQTLFDALLLIRVKIRMTFLFTVRGMLSANCGLLVGTF